MKVYLAASWSRKLEMQEVARTLKREKIKVVVSRWLLESKTKDYTASPAYLRKRSEMDLADVKACDVLVRFSDDLDRVFVPASLATGARMVEMGVEMGLAYAMGKRIVVVGGHQPIFDYLPDVIHFDTADAMVAFLSAEASKTR